MNSPVAARQAHASSQASRAEYRLIAFDGIHKNSGATTQQRLKSPVSCQTGGVVIESLTNPNQSDYVRNLINKTRAQSAMRNDSY